MQVKTVKIKHPEGEGYLTINADAFDASAMEPWEEPSATPVEPTPAPAESIPSRGMSAAGPSTEEKPEAGSPEPSGRARRGGA